MGKLTDSVKSIFGRGKNRVVTRDYGEQLDDWVDEGGAPHPDGPPRVADELPKDTDTDRGR